MTVNASNLLLRLSEARPPRLLGGSEARLFSPAELNRLLADQILVEHAPATDWQVCASCECEMDARTIQEIDGRLIAACPLDARRDTSLEPDGLRTFELQIGRFVGAVAKASGFEQPSELADDLWSLGIASGRSVFWAVTARVLRSAGLIELLAKLASGLPVTLIAPKLKPEARLQFARASIHVVETQHAVVENEPRAMPRFEPYRLLPEDPAPALVVYVSERKILLHGKEKKLPLRSFKLLEFLARRAKAGQGLCSQLEVEEALWGKSVIGERALSSRLRDLRKELATILPKKAKKDELIRTHHAQGYSLTIAPENIKVAP